MSLIDRALRIGEGKKFKQFEKQVELVNAFEPEMELLEDDELATEFASLRERHEGGETLEKLLPHAFALIREASKRTMGMRHFDVQLIGGMVLHHGDIAEMKTGEGKTLTATLPVALNAIAGKGVHVVTVNDYLARRDAEWMSPIYEALGLKVGILQSDVYDWDYKRSCYEADITYGTNSEFGFDYLRDNLAHSTGEKVQRGHSYAIVDEVDNILIDEARTPLIISGQPEQAADYYKQFAKLARQMVQGEKPKEVSSKDRAWVADFDYEADEKYKTVSITELGVEKAEKFLGIENLYLAETGTLVNHLIQALKAESLYKRDVDYAVVDGEAKIIDEFTGRILEGRRWSEGLHQAVEAKEGVAIQEENQTVATITYQNYFRRYDKLSGMTGTALTEATEFMKIYELQVVEIPTNRPLVRGDKNDQIYKTKDGKWSAIEREIVARHEKGQPILVGTIAVETSEMLSKSLKKNGVPHEVLNAKPEYAEREAETIAQAGRPGAVTIATNMAGRGVDIKLGGNAEELAHIELRKRNVDPEDEEAYSKAFDEVLPEFEQQVDAEREKAMAAGGLYVCGTERHESRRIDNQLRGRSGRQGDPGETRFFLSAEDDLVRLFAGDRIYKILDKLGGEDDEGNELPIEAGMLTKQIEGAQKKVEEQNYLSRKRVLEYDDVMNQQREVIYDFRDGILEGADMSGQAREHMHGVMERLVAEYTPGDAPEHWDIQQLFERIDQIFPISFGAEDINVMGMERSDLVDTINEEALEAYEEKEEELSPELMRDLERHVLLEIIDERWREHLNDMDYLREGIHLRGFAEMQPIVAYKNEGFTMFGELIESIWDEFARVIYHFELTDEAARERAQQQMLDQSKSSNTQQFSYSSADAPEYGVGAAVAANMAEAELDGAQAGSPAPGVIPQPAQVSSTAGGAPAGYDPDGNPMSRNQNCWCGSGKRYKNCHGK